jgi:hypothetical protein
MTKVPADVSTTACFGVDGDWIAATSHNKRLVMIMR